jgi:molybdate transport system substrate-binding protein
MLLALAILTQASIACIDDGRETLTVFAAASLTDAFTELAEGFESDNPAVRVRFNFAGSPVLVTQLEHGAEADLLATADQDNMDAALARGVVADAGMAFARNRLAIIVPASNPGGVSSARDLAKDALKLVLAQASVPAGRYARQMLENPEFGGSFASDVLDNVVSEEPNVKAVVTKVQLGEADAGIVYVTDVTRDLAGEVEAIDLPEEFNVIATYPVAVTRGAKQPDLASAFIAYALAEAGQATLEEYGFIPVH